MNANFSATDGFSDSFPATIEYEIDRDVLRRYLRLRALLTCLVIPGAYGLVVGAVIGGAQLTSSGTLADRLVAFCYYFGGCSLIGVAIGLMLYFSFGHFQSALQARQMRLIVEGPFLRIVSGRILLRDRRVHFRAVSDYSTHDGPLLRWFGIKAISFQIMGARTTQDAMVPAIRDADAVRDELCVIDAARE